MSLADYRAKFPQYNDIPDAQLVEGLYKKYGEALRPEEFAAKLGYDPSKQPPDFGVLGETNAEANIKLQNHIENERKAGYDLAGYIKKYGIPDQSKGQHLTDEFKLPHHITFSTDSKYSNNETPGGVWKQIEGKWHYAPSDYVLSQHPAEELLNYFKTREPDSVLDLPISAKGAEVGNLSRFGPQPLIEQPTKGFVKGAAASVPYLAINALKGALEPVLEPLKSLGFDTKKVLDTAIEYYNKQIPEGANIPNVGVGVKGGDTGNVWKDLKNIEVQKRPSVPLKEIAGATAQGLGFVALPVKAASTAAGAVTAKLEPYARPFFRSVARGMITGALLGEGEKDKTLETAALFGIFEGLPHLTEIPKLVQDSTWYRQRTIKERGLVIQSLDDAIAANPDMTEGQLLRKYNNPEWRKQALAKRMEPLKQEVPVEQGGKPENIIRPGTMEAPPQPEVNVAQESAGQLREALKNGTVQYEDAQQFRDRVPDGTPLAKAYDEVLQEFAPTPKRKPKGPKYAAPAEAPAAESEQQILDREVSKQRNVEDQAATIEGTKLTPKMEAQVKEYFGKENLVPVQKLNVPSPVPKDIETKSVPQLKDDVEKLNLLKTRYAESGQEALVPQVDDAIATVNKLIEEKQRDQEKEGRVLRGEREEGQEGQTQKPGRPVQEPEGGEAPVAPGRVVQGAPEQLEQPKAKEPWMMTRDDYVGEGYIFNQTDRALKRELSGWKKKRELPLSNESLKNVDMAIARAERKISRSNEHRSAVEQAVRENKPVPPEVLAEYPDLKPEKANVRSEKSKTFRRGSELANALSNVQGIDKAHLSQFPSGKWGFVGSVDARLTFKKEDGSELTEDDVKYISQAQSRAMAMKARGVKSLAWDTREQAIKSAFDLNIPVYENNKLIKPTPQQPAEKAVVPKKKLPSRVHTLRGAIRKLGGINPVNMKGEFKNMPIDVSRYLTKKSGMSYDLAEQALKADNWLLPDESLIDVLTDPANLKRDRVTASTTEKKASELNSQERELKKQMERQPEAPPEGEYVTMRADELPEGKKLTLLEEKSPDGWDIYEVVESDPFGVTLKDGHTIELKPGDKVQVLREDVGKEGAQKIFNEIKSLKSANDDTARRFASRGHGQGDSIIQKRRDKISKLNSKLESLGYVYRERAFDKPPELITKKQYKGELESYKKGQEANRNPVLTIQGEKAMGAKQAELSAKRRTQSAGRQESLGLIEKAPKGDWMKGEQAGKKETEGFKKKTGNTEEVTASPNDISRSVANSAHRGTSFDPEKRGEQEQQSYVDYFNRAKSEIEKLVETDEDRQIMNEELHRYKQGLIQKFNAKLQAQSRQMSAMIAGPAKFPVRRNKRRMDTADKRRNELTEWDEKARRSMAKRIKPHRFAISSDQENAVELLEKKIADAEKSQETMKAINKIVRSKKLSKEQKIEKIKKDHGFSDAHAEEILKPDYMGREGFAPFETQNNNANIRRMKERVESLKKSRNQETSEIEFDGGTISDNVEDNRVQIFFDNKPDAEIRTKLKGRGFRWAPSVNAWQRQRSPEALRIAKNIVGIIEEPQLQLEAQHGTPTQKRPAIVPKAQGPAQQILDKAFTQAGWGPIADVVQASTEEQRSVGEYLGQFRLETNWFKWKPTFKHDFELNGFILPSHPNQVFLNIESTRPWLAVAGHEFNHTVEHLDPTLYKWYLNELAKYAKGLAKYQEWVNRSRKSAGLKPMNKMLAFKELAADFNGDAWVDPDFYEQLHEADPNLARRLVKIIKKIFARIKRWLRPYKTHKSFTDIDSGYKALARVMKEYAARRAGKAPSQINLFPEFSVERAKTPEVFYSQMQRVLESKLPGSGTPESMLSTIKAFEKKGEFKSEEKEWSGVEDWLKSQTGKVTKQQVLDYLDQNKVQIQEIVKGAATSEDQWYIAYINGPTMGAGYANETMAREDLAELWPDRTDLEIRRGEGERATREIPTKFSQYQLPGGEGYKELLMTLPERKGEAPKSLTELPEGYDLISDRNQPADQRWGITPPGQTHAKPWAGRHATQEEAVTAALNKLNMENFERWQNQSNAYKGGHWDEPNVLAHVRFNERTDANGDRVLFIEEIQSDWHQKGRKEGYKKSRDDIRKALKELYPTLPADSSQWSAKILRDNDVSEDLVKEWWDQRMTGKVPNAPFKKTWPMLAFKRMVRYAAENGFDRISWTPGDIQAERYDLSKQVNSIKAWQDPDKAGAWKLEVGYKNGVGTAPVDVASDSELPDYVGKELADKIIQDLKGKDLFSSDGSRVNSKKYSGLDLKVGGEGMKGFYDKMLVNEVNKFFNKAAWGKAKVEVGKLTTEKSIGEEITPELLAKAAAMADSAGDAVSAKWLGEQVKRLEDTGDYSYAVFNYNKWPDAKEPPAFYVGEVRKFADKRVEVWSLPITPEMQEKALYEGMPQFSIEGKGRWKEPISKYRDYIAKNPEATVEDVVRDTGLSQYQAEHVKELIQAQEPQFSLEDPKAKKFFDDFEKKFVTPAKAKQQFEKLADSNGKIPKSKFFQETGIKPRGTVDPKDIMKAVNWVQVMSDLVKNYPEMKPVFDAQVQRIAESNRDSIRDRELTEPYFTLKSANRKNVDAALLEGDVNGEEYTDAQLGDKFGMTDSEIKGYHAVRNVLEEKLRILVNNMLSVVAPEGLVEPEMVETVIQAKTKEEMIASLKKQGVDSPFLDWLFDWVSERKGYVPHKWKSDWVVWANFNEADAVKKLYGIEDDKWLLEVKTLRGKLYPTRAMRRHQAEESAFRTIMDKFGLSRDDLQKLVDQKKVKVIKTRRLPVDLFEGTRVDVIESVAETATENAWNQFTQGMSKDQIRDVQPLKDLISQNIEELYLGKGWGQHLIARKGFKGYRTDLENVISEYLYGFNSFIAKGRAAKNFAKALKGINPRKTPRMWDYSKEYIQDMLGSSSEAGWFKKVAGTYFLAADLSAATLNMTQNWTHAVPLIKAIEPRTGKITAEQEISKAMLDIAKEWKDNLPKGKKIFAQASNNISQDEIDALRKAYQMGYLDPAMFGEVTGLHSNKIFQNYVKEIFLTLFKLFTGVEGWNRTSTFLASYRRALRSDMSKDAAIEKAVEIVNNAHFIYGRGNRPKIVRRLGAVGNIGYTFETYALQNITFLKHRAEAIFDDIHKGDKKAVKRDLKIFGSHLAYVFAFGGLIGLPFFWLAQPILDFFTQEGYDWEIAIRKKTSKFLGRLITRGVPAALLGNDMSWRVQGTDALGIPIGFQIGQMLLKRGQNAWKLHGQGEDLDALFQLMPDMFRNPYKAVVGFREGGTRKGVPPIKYTPYEASTKALGFTPTREAEAFKSQEVVRNQKLARSKKLENFAERYLIAKKKYDFSEIRAIKKEVFDYNARQRKEGGVILPWADVKASAKARDKSRSKGFGEDQPKYMRKFQKETQKNLGLQ